MSDEEGDFPAWAAPLFREPMCINASTSDEALSRELEVRLEALLRLYNCDAGPAGWRELALRLALKHEDCMRVLTPADRIPGVGGGAEPGKKFWLASMLRKKEREVNSAKKAAEAFAGSSGEVRSLQNLISESKAGRVPKPRWLQRLPWERKIRAAADRAAKALARNHDFEGL